MPDISGTQIDYAVSFVFGAAVILMFASRRLDELLDSLSGVQRAAVVLYYYEDRSVEQVAQAMGIPAGTVKTHLHRARALLRAGWVEEERRSVNP